METSTTGHRFIYNNNAILMGRPQFQSLRWKWPIIKKKTFVEIHRLAKRSWNILTSPCSCTQKKKVLPFPSSSRNKSTATQVRAEGCVVVLSSPSLHGGMGAGVGGASRIMRGRQRELQCKAACCHRLPWLKHACMHACRVLVSAMDNDESSSPLHCNCKAACNAML